MKIRRVVTGHTPDGKATVASDMEIDGIEFPLTPGSEHLTEISSLSKVNMIWRSCFKKGLRVSR